jgi:hypothetical protein
MLSSLRARIYNRYYVIVSYYTAIFFACTYLQSLLRDRLFTIHTDHRNQKSLQSYDYSMAYGFIRTLIQD